MRIEVRADVRATRSWEGEHGEAGVEVSTENAWAEDLPWEQICAALVQTAIADFREKSEAADAD